MEEIVIKKDVPTATCIWCGWLHPHCHHLHPLFSLSLPPFGIIIWVIINVVVVVPVWPWCGVVCCSDVHIDFFFFTEVISACPQLIIWHWLKSTLSHINMHLYSCHHQHQQWTATITTISNTNARDEGRGQKFVEQFNEHMAKVFLPSF